MTQIASLYSDRTLKVLEVSTLEVYIKIMRSGGRVDGISIPRDELLAALGAEEAATPVLALAEAREQRDQARKAASDLKGVIDRSVVIDRSDLPTVETAGTGASVGVPDVVWAARGSDPILQRRLAMAHLAIAEYIEAHPRQPPVDQAQVEALVNAIRSDPDLDAAEDPYAAAERLVRQGWTKAEATEGGDQ